MGDIDIRYLQGKLPTSSIRYFDSVESSNDIAMTWLRRGADCGSVVIADEQRKGRGRKGRTWYTPSGQALAFSHILCPPHNLLQRVSMMAAVGVAQLCEDSGIGGVGIKWPNDVQIHGKKICGILPEAVWEDNRLLGVAVGIGVNVHTEIPDAEVEQLSTSMEIEVKRMLNRNDLYVALIRHLGYWAQHIASDDLFNAWKQRLNMLGQPIIVPDSGIRGVARTVEPDGTLVIDTEENGRQQIIAGDVMLGQ